jgi:hypothetical protein
MLSDDPVIGQMVTGGTALGVLPPLSHRIRNELWLSVARWPRSVRSCSSDAIWATQTSFPIFTRLMQPALRSGKEFVQIRAMIDAFEEHPLNSRGWGACPFWNVVPDREEIGSIPSRYCCRHYRTDQT